MKETNHYDKITFALTVAGFIGSVIFYVGVLKDLKKKPTEDKQKIADLEKENRQLKAVIDHIIKNEGSVDPLKFQK